MVFVFPKAKRPWKTITNQEKIKFKSLGASQICTKFVKYLPPFLPKYESDLAVCCNSKSVPQLLKHSGPENLKKSRPKKLVKSNKSISRKKIFWPNSISCHFKNGQKSIFELEKSLKLPKMQFHKIFCLDFFKFSGPLRLKKFQKTLIYNW